MISNIRDVLFGSADEYIGDVIKVKAISPSTCIFAWSHALNCLFWQTDSTTDISVNTISFVFLKHIYKNHTSLINVWLERLPTVAMWVICNWHRLSKLYAYFNNRMTNRHCPNGTGYIIICASIIKVFYDSLVFFWGELVSTLRWNYFQFNHII